MQDPKVRGVPFPMSAMRGCALGFLLLTTSVCRSQESLEGVKESVEGVKACYLANKAHPGLYIGCAAKKWDDAVSAQSAAGKAALNAERENLRTQLQAAQAARMQAVAEAVTATEAEAEALLTRRRDAMKLLLDEIQKSSTDLGIKREANYWPENGLFFVARDGAFFVLLMAGVKAVSAEESGGKQVLRFTSRDEWHWNRIRVEGGQTAYEKDFTISISATSSQTALAAARQVIATFDTP